MGPSRKAKAVVRLLLTYCPVDYPVRIEYVRRLSWCADTHLHRGEYVVRIAVGLTPDLEADVIAHEWAHAMAWRKSRIDHGEAWARAYSRCYRVVVDGWRPRRGGP